MKRSKVVFELCLWFFFRFGVVDVLEEILRFIYSGRAANMEKLADELLAAADKVGLPFIFSFLLSNASSNVFQPNFASFLLSFYAVRTGTTQGPVRRVPLLQSLRGPRVGCAHSRGYAQRRTTENRRSGIHKFVRQNAPFLARVQNFSEQKNSELIFINRFSDSLIDWLIGGSVDWLIDWLTDGLIDWLIDWLIDGSVERLIDWLMDWWIGGSIDWLIDWFSENGLFLCFLLFILDVFLSFFL